MMGYRLQTYVQMEIAILKTMLATLKPEGQQKSQRKMKRLIRIIVCHRGRTIASNKSQTAGIIMIKIIRNLALPKSNFVSHAISGTLVTVGRFVPIAKSDTVQSGYVGKIGSLKHNMNFQEVLRELGTHQATMQLHPRAEQHRRQRTSS